jgi:hypothetical protein
MKNDRSRYSQGQEPFRIITDKLKSYSAALRTILCDVDHNTERYAKNRRRSLASTDPQGNDTCADSSLLAKRSGFSPSMLWSRISFELAAIC